MRSIIFLLGVVGVLFFSGSVADEIKVSLVVPDQVNAGESFQVIINIDKGSVRSLSRFQQDLPYGLTASSVTTSNADFNFENQRVRFIWLKLPAEEKIQISYDVQVDERLKGNFKLAGEFSFIQGDQRTMIDVDADKVITIVPSKNIAENQIVDIKDFEAAIMSKRQAQAMLSSLMVQRKVPVQLNQREYLVNIKVNKGFVNRFARIEEYIPEGYSAFEVDSKNGIFSFQDQVVKILWLDVPDEPDFIVSYKLFKNSGKADGVPDISGTFSYVDGNQTKSLNIIERDYDLAILTSGDTVRGRDLVSGAISPGMEGRVSADRSTVRERPPADQRAIQLQTGEDKSMLKPEDGIYFRVQIFASYENIDTDSFFDKFKLILSVKKEFHEGLMKYSVGSFSNYKDASDYCSYLWRETSIDDAFVVAYHNGRRIPVQDALMMKP